MDNITLDKLLTTKQKSQLANSLTQDYYSVSIIVNDRSYGTQLLNVYKVKDFNDFMEQLIGDPMNYKNFVKNDMEYYSWFHKKNIKANMGANVKKIFRKKYRTETLTPEIVRDIYQKYGDEYILPFNEGYLKPVETWGCQLSYEVLACTPDRKSIDLTKMCEI